jgi:uncharacterized protein YbbK (DUF523 family)
VSSCLLGAGVRYDGGHKRDRRLIAALGRAFDLVGVCPETECGLGVPREPLRLAGDPRAPRLVTVRTGVDHTVRMRTWAERRLAELEREGLCGFVFKARSPSCGTGGIKVGNGRGEPAGEAAGLFARACMDRFPFLPCEEAERLADPVRRESFIARVRACRQSRRNAAPRPGNEQCKSP